MAHACELQEAHSFVTPTGIFLFLQGQDRNKEQTRFIRIAQRQIDLNKIVRVNDISRKISTGSITLEEAYQELLQVEKSQFLYPFWLQIVSAALASGFFSLMFGGSAKDFLPSVLIAAVGFLLFVSSSRWIKVKFFAELLSAFIIAALALLFHYLNISEHTDKVIIGSIMPLVPGVSITNAVRDLMAGDLVSGLARGAEAFFTALAIGTGVAVILSIFA